jgi:putative heme transporter
MNDEREKIDVENAQNKPPTPDANRTKRRLVSLLGFSVIVLVFAIALPKIANFGEVWRLVRSLSSSWVAMIALISALNVATFAPNWIVALPGLTYMQSMKVTMAGSAIATVLPLGGAVSMPMQLTMFRRWGFSPASSSRAMILTGIWNNLTNFGLPIVGLVVLTLKGGKNAVLSTTARVGAVLFLIGVVLVVSVFASENAARRIGERLDKIRNRIRPVQPPRQNGPSAFAAFRLDSIQLLKRRWHLLTVATLIGTLTTYALLMVLLRGLHVPGIQLTAVEIFAAWSLSRLLSAIPITPGGLGITDIGLTGALISFGGNREKVVAAVLLYRVLGTIPPLVLGGLTFLGWRKTIDGKTI